MKQQPPSFGLVLVIACVTVCIVAKATASFVWSTRSCRRPKTESDRTLSLLLSERNGRETVEDELHASNGALTVQPIGVIHSVYRLCVGTPRQGLLAMHARGRIQLVLDKATVDGLEGFSHIWIVFVFHLNTVGKRASSQPTKISPPALGGQRVGVFATRSPHRMNPIGLTLAKLDGIRTVKTFVQGKRPLQTTYLEVSGLDLVDGTPVLDIKPYVPAYDAPLQGGDACQLPTWVSDGLATQRSVELSDQALAELREILLSGGKSPLEFYGHHGESTQEALANMTSCIREVLSIDVRSQWQTQKARQGNFKAERAQRLCEQQVEVSPSTLCTQQIDNLMVYYEVVERTEIQREESIGSGAEDLVRVQSIKLLHNNQK